MFDALINQHPTIYMRLLLNVPLFHMQVVLQASHFFLTLRIDNETGKRVFALKAPDAENFIEQNVIKFELNGFLAF